MRCLEIGPKKGRIPGFETLDLAPSPIVDHVGDARKLPFADGTFGIVYSSHVLEHIEWWQIEATVGEWARVVEPGGWLEVHCLNALDLMRALVTMEDTGEWIGPTMGTWRQDLIQGDPYVWCAARIMNFPKGGSELQKHRAIITPKYLERCFEAAGLVDLEPLTRDDMRGSRHPEFINVGLKGRKP